MKKKKICHELWTLFSLCFCAETLCKAAVCSGGGGSRVHYTGSVGPLQARVAGASQGVLLITNLGKLTDKHKKKKKCLGDEEWPPYWTHRRCGFK